MNFLLDETLPPKLARILSFGERLPGTSNFPSDRPFSEWHHRYNLVVLPGFKFSLGHFDPRLEFAECPPTIFGMDQGRAYDFFPGQALA